MTFLKIAWIIPLLPLLSAGLLALLGKRLRAPFGGLIAVGAVGLSFVFSVLAYVGLMSQSAHHRVFTKNLYTWITGGGFDVKASIRVDPLTIIMLLLVSFVGLMIHIYANGYMKGDPDFTRFFSYLNLFVAGMLILVLANDFLVLFVGWELVGACSYLLIGFWYNEPINATAGKKAMIVNRIGDFGFVIAMMLIFFTFGSLDFSVVFAHTDLLSTGVATAIALLLLMGVTGKSAQIPLYLWLPDAMQGPTPVSALMHAATMVVAGVYLIARVHPIFDLAPAAQLITVFIGSATTVWAAIIALGQNNFKKILAYSTISQIGYMVAGVGIGAAGYTAGLFHMLTHGFFKALLFLCAGSVMHGMGGEEDIRKMGNLRKKMPVTHITYLCGLLAICGIFPFSGFWSKDAVLSAEFTSHYGWGKVTYVLGLIGALLTAMYMFRQYYRVFWGKANWAEGVKPHESPKVLTVPLGILAVGATLLGVLGIPDWNVLHKWLEPTFETAGGAGEVWSLETIVLFAVSLAVALIGVAIATKIWLKSSAGSRAKLATRFGPLPQLAAHKFYYDEATQMAFERPGWDLVKVLEIADQKGVDGAVLGTAHGITSAGRFGRKLQTGYVRLYAAVILGGALLIVVYMMLRGGSGV